jgi:O-antigen ligase
VTPITRVARLSMPRHNHHDQTGKTRRLQRPWFVQWSDQVVVLGVCITPLFIVLGAKDTFRLPKDVLFRAEAIVLLAIALVALILYRAIPQIDSSRRFVLLPLLLVGWTAIATLFSTNRARSIDSLTTVCAGAIIYIATLAAARRSSFTVILAAVVPALMNAVVGALQEFDIWRPLPTPTDIWHHLRSTAFIGNPNDAGGYLAVVTVASLAAAVVSRTSRKIFGILTGLLVAGLLVNQTLAAILATTAGMIALLALVSWKRAAIAVVAVAILFTAAVATLPPLHERYMNTRGWLQTGDYNAMLTDRLTPFVAAFMMFRDRPLIGVGPGCFAWQFMPYKVRAELAYPSLRSAFHRGTNFGEVHNDHLQLLAEGGIFAYGLSLAALAALSTISFRRRERDKHDTRYDFARLLALPLAVTFFVLALAQFPLELTAVMSQFLFFAALCVAWRGP